MAGPQSHHDLKCRLRGELRFQRSALSDAARTEASRRIAEHVLALPHWRDARTVMLYLSLPEEVGTEDLAQAVLDQGKRLCLPRLERGHTMEAVHVESLSGMALAGLPLSVRQPMPGVGEVVAPSEIDLNLIPCVGMDRRGTRLGLGGGHYDRFLRGAQPEAANLGLLFTCQIVDTLPRAPHDHPLSGFVTEEGVEWCGGAAG